MADDEKKKPDKQDTNRDPQIAVRTTEQANRESGQAKLKALGLTDAEVAALSSK